MKASDVKTRVEGQSLSFRGLLGETHIDVLPSGFRTADGLEVSETIRIESVLDTPPLPLGEEVVCLLNEFASHEALLQEEDRKLRLKSRLSLYSREGEDV